MSLIVHPDARVSISPSFTLCQIAAAEHPALFSSLSHQLAAAPTDHPDYASNQTQLGLLFQTRHRRTGALTDLNASIKHFHAAIAATPLPGPTLARYQQSLAMSYIDRFKRLRDDADLKSALEFQDKALIATPADHPDFPLQQHSLGLIYIEAFTRFGNTDDLELALFNLNQAVFATPADHPQLASRQAMLATAHSYKYLRLGDLNALRSGFIYFKAAIAATPLGHPDLPGYLQNLSSCYRLRFVNLGALHDLERALQYNKAAVFATPADHPDLPHFLNHLASCYGTHFQRLGNMQDLKLAIAYFHKAIVATPDGHPALSGRQLSLATAYTDFFERTGDLDVLDAAIQNGNASVIALPADHPNLPLRQHYVSSSYFSRYKKLHKLQDLNDAIRLNLASVAGTPVEHPEFPARQHALAVCYRSRFRVLEAEDDLDLALKHDHLALSKTPVSHQDLSDHQQGLALSYQEQFEKFQDIEALFCALFYFRASSQSTSALPMFQWASVVSWASLAFKINLLESLEAYSKALSLIPDLLWMANPVSTRHEVLLHYDIPALVAKAVSACIHFQKMELGVEFLEQSLSITYKQLLQLRDEPTALDETHPQLATKLRELSLDLQQNTMQFVPSGTGGSSPSHDVHLIAIERSALIQEIRKLPGFSDLLLPSPYTKLRAAAHNGPVIMINCTSAGSDVLVILPSNLLIQHLDLPGASLEEAQKRLDDLRVALSLCNIKSRNRNVGHAKKSYPDIDDTVTDTTQQAQLLFQAVTSWLWSNLVSPVFNILHDNNIHGGRIWWCPAGPFTYLPLHAAAPLGHNCYIQSYTSTLDALLHANNRYATIRSLQKDITVTAIAVPELSSNQYDTHQLSALPGTLNEINSIQTVVGSHRVTTLVGASATCAHVVSAIANSTWVHFACHGEQVPKEPLKSRLFLYDGDLKLQEILSIHPPNAEFAFLSACETAMGDASLANEAMHLAGGLIASGFCGVIGTLWSVADHDSAEVARRIYRRLFSKKGRPDTSQAAQALHIVVQAMRKGNLPFHHWMQFIHMGV